MTPLQERVLIRRITLAGSCWEWDKAGKGGYGRAGFARLSQYAHRAVWQLLVGPLDRHLQLDHLEPITGRENKRRSPITLNSMNVVKTTCPQGHPYDVANTLVRNGKKGQFRTCLVCKRDFDRENARRYRAARAAARA